MIIIKKILAFLKNYWYTPIIILGLLTGYFFLSGGGVKQVKSIFEAAKRRYLKDKQDIDNIHRDKDKKKEDIANQTVKDIKQLQEDKEEDLENLEKEKQKSVEDKVKRYNEDPDSFTKEVSEFFNFSIFNDNPTDAPERTREREEALHKESKEG